MSVQEVRLSRIVYRIPLTARAVQGDTGRQLKMIIEDETLVSGCVATLCFQRPDGTEYDAEATLVLADNAFTADLTQGLTQEGLVKCQLSVLQSSLTVSTYLFFLEVQKKVSGPITEEEYATVQDAENAAVLANQAAEAANSAATTASDAASAADTAKTAANNAAQAANDAAERAAAYAGGSLDLTDMRDGKQYAVAFVVTANGEPKIIGTEVEE